MTSVTYDPTMVLAVLPQICLLGLGLLVLAFDLALSETARRNLGWLTAVGLAATLVATAIFAQPPAGGRLVWGGMLRQDWLGYVFELLFLAGAALTALFAMDVESIGRRGEFYLLLIAATMGMTLMAGSADLVMLFLAIETTSIPLYALAGFLTRDQKSAEAGFKYVLFGATTSAVMLYGFSLLYGFSGTTQLYEMTGALRAGGAPLYSLLAVLLLVLVGFSFKISAVPFQFWAPDIYEGAPAPVAGFLSTASKAAGFAVVMRFLLVVFPVAGDAHAFWMALVAAMATASMIVGNLLALGQKNIKRLLAYSSIAQAGYMLIGVAAASSLGITAAVYYLTVYLLTNLAAFGVVTVVGRVVGSDDISAYAGLSRRAPGLSLLLLVALLSLGGIPPFGGFFAKVLVFAAAVEQPALIWLAVIGILNAIVALYYYLTVLKTVYLYRSEAETRPLHLTGPWKLALAVCVLGVIGLGTLIGPWYNWSMAAAGALLH